MPINNDLRFSVLMPVYIKENPAFLEASLQSILDHQTLAPNEVVIVEDGPITPELDKVLNVFQARFPSQVKRFKLKQNQGMGKAMNFGLQQISHDWVARMDSDDIAKPDRFEVQINFLKANPNIDVLGSAIEEFNNVPQDQDSMRILPSDHTDIAAFMKRRNPINHMTVIFRRVLALKAGGYWDERYFEDYNLWYEMYKCGAVFHNMTESLVSVRTGNNMIERRSGYAYFKYEKILLAKFRNDRFITVFEYLFLFLIKFFLRVLPTSVLRVVYRNFLRNKSS